MKQGFWTITVLNVRGIPIRIHLTFLLFLGLILATETNTVGGALSELAFILGLFFCVALHELGHAFAASRFGIKTRDIVLYPFGGIASIAAMPTPRAELTIAIAGPLVNVAIALVLLPFISVERILSSPTFIDRIFVVNIVLTVFNLVPALPMDGGRVLRALLELGEFRNATLISSRVSQAISVTVGILALIWGRMDLLIISIVVFFGAAQERFHAQAKSAVRGHRVKDAMIDAPRLESFSHGVTISQALNQALKSLQEFFPVLYGSQLIGVVEKQNLFEHAADGGPESYISEVTTRNFPVVTPESDLATVLEQPETQDAEYHVVMENGVFVGMLLKEKVLEFLLIDDLKRRMTESHEADDMSQI